MQSILHKDNIYSIASFIYLIYISTAFKIAICFLIVNRKNKQECNDNYFNEITNS